MSSIKKKKQIVGYKYYMGLHMAVCHGPVDVVQNFIVDDRVAWSGSQTTSGQISINVPNLFGGDNKEGGIVGALDVLMGESTQGVNDYLAAKIGSNIPAFRGVLSFVYRGGQVSANTPYVKKWAIKVKRILQGWGTDGAFYPAKAEVPGYGMNPAHIIYQCLTNKSWGMGYPIGLMDTVDFTAAADALYTEGFGLNMLWNQQDTIENFVQQVLSHINAVVYVKPDSGKFSIKLIRDDYNPASVMELNPSNVVELESFQRAAWGETTNEIVVIYRDVGRNADVPVAVQDIGNIQAQGGVVSQTRQYPGIGYHDLAARVAMRDLATVSNPLAKVTLRVNRTGWQLTAGDVFKLVWPDLGLAGVFFRIAKIDHGTLQDGTITIDAVEDIFGMPASTYVEPEPVGWVEPTAPPASPAYRRVEEAPYYEIVQVIGDADAQALASTACFFQAAAARPNGLYIDFELNTKTSSEANYLSRGRGPFCPSAVTSADIGLFDTSFVYTSDTDMDQVEVGSYLYLENEALLVDNINTTTKTLTVKRGCMDTVPVAHSSGARLWGFGDFQVYDFTEFATSETVNAKILPRTIEGQLDLASATTDSKVMAGRMNKPMNGGAFSIDTDPTPDYLNCDLSLTWYHRNRLTMTGEQMPYWLWTSSSQEANVTYTVKIYGQDETTLIRTYSGITGQSQAYTMNDEVADSATLLSGAPNKLNTKLRFEFYSVRSGVECHQRFNITVPRIGWGYNWGEHWGGETCAGYPTTYQWGDSFVAPVVSSFRYFRLEELKYYYASLTMGTTGDVRVAELEYIVSGTAHPTSNMTGPSAPSPLVATASTDDGSRPAWKAFEGNLDDGNRWISNTAGGTQWLQIDLGSGNDIEPDQYKIAPDGAASSNYSPGEWKIKASNTGSFSGEETVLDHRKIMSTGTAGGWANNTLRTFDIPTGSGTAHRYWRVRDIEISGGSHMEISELQLCIGGTDQNSAATITASLASDGSSGGGDSDLWDGSTGTRAYWTVAKVHDSGGLKIKWDFGVGVTKAIDGVKVGGFDTANRCPVRLTVEYSDDDTTWVTAGHCIGISYPGNSTLSSALSFDPPY